jgi:hypothetical protein
MHFKRIPEFEHGLGV